MLLHASSLIVGLIVVTAAAAQDTSPQPALGWKWLLPPTLVDPSDDDSLDGKIEGGKYDFGWDSKKGLELELELTIGWQRQGIDNEYRGVAFDVDGVRYEVPQRGASGSGGKMTIKALLPADRLPPSKLRRLGIEVLTPEGRAIVAEDAQRRARGDNIEVMPLPQVGRPYDFDIATIDGRRVSSAALRGEVVLIDGWATWCGPCMQKMPKLAEFYEKRRGDGFEIVGVNFDKSIDDARKAIEEKRLAWPHVHVPNEDAVRNLWYEASSFSTLPRLVVIDREGIVRAQCNPSDLLDTIEKQLGAQGGAQPATTEPAAPRKP